MKGLYLKALRNKLGLTAKEAGEQVGVDKRTWNRWEAKEAINNAAVRLFEQINIIELEKPEEEKPVVKKIKLKKPKVEKPKVEKPVVRKRYFDVLI